MPATSSRASPSPSARRQHGAGSGAGGGDSGDDIGGDGGDGRLQWQSTWGRLPGLRLHVWCTSMWHRTPGLVFSLMWAWLLNRLSPSGALLWLLLAYIVQNVAHKVGSWVIMPGQSSTLRTLAWLGRFQVVARRLPMVQGLQQQLTALHDQAEHLRGRLTAVAGARRLAVTTPDGAVLDGMWMPPASSTALRGAVIYVPGNAERYEFSLPVLARQHHQQGLAYLVFNYRGVGASTGSTTRDGMLVDLACMVDFLRCSEGFASTHVVLTGHSIGGGVATELAALVPGVNVCSDRSFASLSLVSKHTLLDGATIQSPHWFNRAVCRGVVWLIKYGVLWEMDSAAYWPLIRGHKWSCAVPTDAIITPPTQLYTVLRDQPGADTSVRALGRVLRMGPGGDGHNRMWTPAELSQHLQFIHDALEDVELKAEAAEEAARTAGAAAAGAGARASATAQ